MKKNKKWFKTLSISATSLAVVAAAVTAPLVVMSNKSKIQQKKDQEVNDDVAKAYEIDSTTESGFKEITSTSSITMKRGKADGFYKIIYLTDSTGEPIPATSTVGVASSKLEEGSYTISAIAEDRENLIPGLYKLKFLNGEESVKEGDTDTITITATKEDKTKLIVDINVVVGKYFDANEYVQIKNLDYNVPLYRNGKYEIKFGAYNNEGSEIEYDWTKSIVYAEWAEDGGAGEAVRKFNKLTNSGNGTFTLENVPVSAQNYVRIWHFGNFINYCYLAEGEGLKPIEYLHFDLDNMPVLFDNYVSTDRIVSHEIGFGQTRNFRLIDALGNTITDLTNFEVGTKSSNGISVAKASDGKSFVVTGGNEDVSQQFTITNSLGESSGYSDSLIDITAVKNYVQIASDSEFKKPISSITVPVGESKTVYIKTNFDAEEIPEGLFFKWTNNNVILTKSENVANQYTISTTATENTTFNIAVYGVTNDEAAGGVQPVDGLAPTDLTVKVGDAVDHTLKAPKETPKGKTSTATETNTFKIEFTPSSSSVAETMQASDWSASVVGTPVATVKEIKCEGDGAARKVVVYLDATTTAGSGTVKVYHKDEGEVEQGFCDFYTYSKEIKLTGSDTQTMTQSQTLAVTADGDAAQATDFNWFSSDDNICTVDANGKLTYKNTTPADTPVKITAKLKAESFSQASFNVTIKDAKLSLLDDKDKTISGEINKTVSSKPDATDVQSMEITLKDTDNIDPTENITWSSDDDTVATVSVKTDGSGNPIPNKAIVKYHSQGKATITAKFEIGSYSRMASATFKLTPYTYGFINAEGEPALGTAKFIPDATSGTVLDVPMYTSTLFGSAKTLSIQRSGKSQREESLAKVVWDVKAIDEDGNMTGEEPAISINSETGAVSVNGFGRVGITAKNLDDTCTETFYGAYDVTEETLTVTGYENKKFSDSDIQLKAKVGEQVLTSENYNITWSVGSENVRFTLTTDGKLTPIKLEEKGGETSCTGDVEFTVVNKTTGYTYDGHQTITIAKDTLTVQSETLQGKMGSSATQYLFVNGTKIDPAAHRTAGGSISFEIVDPTIATVTDTGVVSFLQEGTTTMNIKYKPARSVEGKEISEQTKTCNIKVEQSDLQLNYTWIIGTPGTDSVQLKAYNNSGWLESGVTFGGYDPEMIKVDDGTQGTELGRIHFLKYKGEGHTTITVTYTPEQGSPTTTTCDVYMYEPHWTLSDESISAYPTDKAKKLHAYLNGWEVPESMVTWESSNTTCVTVSNETGTKGQLTYLKNTGDSPVTISLKYGDVKVASCQVTLNANTFTTNLPGSIDALSGTTRQILCCVNGLEQPIGTTIYGKAVTFTIPEEEQQIVTVSDTGLLSFLKAGTANVTVSWVGFGDNPMTVTITIYVLK